MNPIKITGTFKSYTDLLNVYGTDTSRPIDEDFDGFLHKIADKDCILANFNPHEKSFDATLIINGVQEIPFGKLKAYTENLGLDTLVSTSINCDNCDEHIFCTGCGYQVSKDTRNDYAAERLTYGDVFNGDCTANDTGNISGATIAFNACDAQGNMYCPKCRSYQEFKEYSDVLP